MKLNRLACAILLLGAPLLAAPGGGFLGTYLSEGGEGDKGALVEEIAPGSPAASADLRKGDQIVSANGTRTQTSKALMELLSGADAGTELALVVDRDGWSKTIKVKLGTRPTAAAPEPGVPQPKAAKPGERTDTYGLPQGERGFLGVYFGQGSRGQAVVSGVVEGSPAAVAGIQKDDVIQSVNGRAMPDPSSIVSLLGTMPPGTAVDLGVVRLDKPMNVKVTLGRRGMETAPPKPLAEAAKPRDPDPKAKKPGYLGVALEDADGKGPLKVEDVQANSPAERFGLVKGDVILAVGDTAVRTVEQFAKAMEPKVAGEVAVIKIDRDGWKNEVRVTLAERP